MKKIKLYEDFSVFNPEKILISFSEFIYESQQTEDRARAILKELPNKENLIAEFRQGDVSNNKINIPLMAYLYQIQATKNTEQIIELVNQYGELLAKKQIEAANITKEGIKIGVKVFNDYLKFAEHIHSFREARSGDWKISQEEMNNFKAHTKPMWSGNNIDIYDGNNVGKCIAYTQGGLVPGKSYTFCIGQYGSSNLYKSYRDREVSTFYFIVDKNKFKLNNEGKFDDSDPLHMVVFDMTKHGPVLTDANNRTGNIAKYGSDTQKYIKYLKGKGVPVEKLLVNIPKTKQQIYEDRLLGRQNEDLEWFKNLDNPKNPDWREPKREQGDPKESYYKFCYIGRGHLLSDEQFDYLMEYKFEMLLKKYVDTGLLLPGYQVNKLTKELKDTYIRKRLIAVEQDGRGLEDYEFELLTPEQQIQYAMKRAEKGWGISNNQFRLLTQDQRFQHVMKRVENDGYISDDQFRLLSQEQMGQYAMKVAQNGHDISDDKFELLTPDQKIQYAMKVAQNGHDIRNDQFELLEPDQRFQYAMKRAEKRKGISNDQFKLLTQDQRFQYAMKRVETGWGISLDQFKLLEPDQRFQYAMKSAQRVNDITDDQFELLTQDQRFQYAMKMAEKDGYISYDQFKLLSQDQKIQYAMKMVEKGYRIPYDKFYLLTPEQQKMFIDNGGKVYDTLFSLPKI